MGNLPGTKLPSARVETQLRWVLYWLGFLKGGGFCKNSDFDGFDLFIKKVMPEKVNAPYVKWSVKQISQSDFNKSFDKWVYDGSICGNRKPFERMYAIAKRFKELLEEKGL